MSLDPPTAPAKPESTESLCPIQITLLFPQEGHEDLEGTEEIVVFVIICSGEETPRFVETTLKSLTSKQIKAWLESYAADLPKLQQERLRRKDNPKALPPPVNPVIAPTETKPSVSTSTQNKLF
jgi:hypothetical protein